MNKKSTMMFIVMLLAVSAAGLVLLKYYGQEHQYTPAEETLNPETSGEQANNNVSNVFQNFTIIEEAQYYFNLGDLNASIAACGNVSNGSQWECLGRIAVQAARTDVNTGVNVCRSLGYFSDAQLNCYTSIASILAVNNNVSGAWGLCKELGHMMCDNAVIRIVLKKNVTEAINLCRSYGAWYNECDCFWTIIITNQSNAIGMCYEMSLKCRDDCLIYVASNSAGSNPRYAMEICSNASEYEVDRCWTTIAGIISKSNESLAFNICNNINKERKKNFCYNQINYAYNEP